MDELVDELSSAMIDVDETFAITGVNSTSNDKYISANTESAIRGAKTHHKPVERTASILIRSKLLILSDSESDDDNTNSGINSKMSQLSARKGKKRMNRKQKLCHQERHKLALQMQYTGKRKRSSTISEGTSVSATTAGVQMECDSHMSDSSSLSDTESDECRSDLNCDGDDEQSDFYEVIARTNARVNQRQRHHNVRQMEAHFPTAPTRNPFLTMGLSSSVSSYNSSLSSTMLWKRRRRMH